MFKKFRRRGKSATKYQICCTVLRLDHIPSTASQVKVLLAKNNKEAATSFVPVTHCAAFFNQQLESTATVYSDAETGLPEPKEFSVKIIGKIGGKEATIGKAKLDVARFTTQSSQGHENCLSIQILFVQGSIALTGSLSLTVKAQEVDHDGASVCSRSSSLASTRTSENGQSDTVSVSSSAAGTLASRKDQLPEIQEGQYEGSLASTLKGTLPRADSGPRVDRISSKVYPETAEVATLKKQVAELQMALETAQTYQATTLAEGADRYKVELDKLRGDFEQAQAAHDLRVSELEDQIAELEDSAKAKEAQIVELEAEAKEADERILELEAELDSGAFSAIGAQANRLIENPEKDRKLKELQDCIQTLEAKLATQNAELEAAKTHIRDAERAPFATRSMRRTAAAVQSFSDDSSSDGSMGDTSAQERVMDLEQSLAAAERRAAEASCQIEALETSLAEAEKEGRQAQLRIEELESASVRAVAKADELQAAYKRLEKLELELTGAERKAALLAEELEVVREELARSAGSEETVEELGREVTELRAALVEERKQRNVAEEALAVAEEKLEDLRGLTEADQEELRSTVDDRDALKQQVAELNHKLKAMESHTQILAAGWEEKVERVRKQLQEREDEIAGMEPAHAIEPLRRECNDARAALIVAEAASAAAIAEIRDLKAQLQSAADKAQAAVRTLEAEIRAGKEREAQLVGELDDVRDSVACLNAQLWKDEKRERAGVGDLAHIHEDVEGLALRDWPAEMNANGGDNGPTQQLPRQAASLPAQLEAVQVELVTLKKRVARQTEELAGRDARLADLESELKGAAAQLQELKALDQSRVTLDSQAGGSNDLARAQARCRELEDKLQAAERALDGLKSQPKGDDSRDMAVASSMRPALNDHLRGWQDDATTDFSGRSHYENGHDDYDEEVERELTSLRLQLKQSKEENRKLKSKIADIDVVSGASVGEQEAFQAELAKLRLNNHSDGQGAEVTELRQLLEKTLAEKEALERANQAMMTNDIEEEINRRIAEVFEVKEAEFEKLVAAWQDAEQHLVNEADLAHQEVLEMRKQNYRLEMALRDSEAKRELMQAQKNLVEQQLQETAGDLVQAERELSRSGVRTPGAESTRGLRASGTVNMIDDLEKELSKYKQEFDSIMTELVEKKVELAELADKYTRLQHDYTRLRDDKNGVPKDWKKGRK